MSIQVKIEDQRKLGAEAERIITNFKKDSSSRKTISYYETRVRQLEELRTQLQENHQEINSSEALKEHEYIREGYFPQIMELIEKYLEQWSIELSQLEDQPVGPAPTSQSTDVQQLVRPAPTSQATDIHQLVRLQRANARALQRSIEAITKDDVSVQTEAFLQVKLGIVEDYLQQLKQRNDVIWQNVNGEDIDGYHIDDFYKWEWEAQDVLVMLHTHLAAKAQVTHPSNNGIQHSKAHLKLPNITLPTFNGNPLQWIAFKDLYMQLIHCQPYSAVEKMVYLTTNLSGEPSNLIRHLPVTTENYEAAWELLTNRYDNKRLLVTSLLNRLINQPTIRQPTSAALKSLHDVTRECIHGLKAQGLTTEHWDIIIVHLTLQKLDSTTLTSFEQTLDDSKRLLSLKEVLQFLELRFQSLETLSRGPGHSHTKTCALLNGTSTDGHCKICNGEKHQPYSCKVFLQGTVADRWQLVRRHSLCINCLKPGHQERTCNARHCTKCLKKHNSLLHAEGDRSSNPAQKLEFTKSKNDSLAASVTAVSLLAKESLLKPNYVLLATARIKVAAVSGPDVECRAILDPGSQVNIITENLARQLDVRLKPTSVRVEGVNKQQSTTKQRTRIHLKSRINKFEAEVEALVFSTIVCDQPSQYIETSKWDIPKNISLADPEFYKPGPIDCLLGSEIFFHLLSSGQITLMNGHPVLQNSLLGWIVAGRVEEPQLYTATCGVLTNDQLDMMLAKFWKLEEIDESETSLSPDERLSEAHFSQNTQRLEGGRIMVRLPFKDDLALLGESRGMAYNRFMSIEKRLAKNHEIKQQYTNFMQEYIELGHMTEVDPENIMAPHYFIPHHYVLKPDSSTTKLRVVFDASARTSSSSSLNDLMYTGRVVQSELFSILLRFRMPRYVVKTDIEKMYRQILVHPEDRQLQLIMWRSAPTEPIKYYQLNTVTYGTRAAPFLATRALLQLAEENATKYPLGAKVLKSDFYVDDGLTGSDCLPEAIETKNQLITILDSAGMKLKKWSSNHPEIMQGIPTEDQEVSLDLDNEVIKTMGLLWLPNTDEFCIKTKIGTTERVTKRTVLSDLAHIFDPLGLASPIVVTAKIFLQKLWQLQLQWDEMIPQDMQARWISFRHELSSLDNAKMDRHIFNHQGVSSVQLHAFADASKVAYGAAIYVRTVKKDKCVMVRVLCAKSRVAPIRTQTIPRLELCAALLAAELMDRVKRDLNYHDKPSFYWTDSQIVLAWLNQQASSFETFVANRVAKIQRLSIISAWRHVPTNHNPADVLSRGLSPRNFPTCHIWFYGPLFLHQDEKHWPPPFNKELCIIDHTEHIEHKKPSPVVAASTSPNTSFIYTINSRNSFATLQRVICYMQRFIERTRHPSKDKDQQFEISPIELDVSLNIIVKQVQQIDFQDVLRMLRNNNCVPNTHSLCSLAPFLDEKGILRVGGRTQSSTLPYDAKHPILLPYNDPVVKLIMEDIHKGSHHCGPQALLAETRQRFWPLKGKIMARSIVHKCVQCTRAKPKLFNQVMGQLPPSRVEPSRPFLTTGVDYCGPFWVHYKVRGKKPQKAYLAIFCCFATKAVHMELVTDLTTDAFIGALKRFFARRGHCKTLFCDNATNFVGARNQLAELSNTIFSAAAKASVINACATKGISFKFIPPRAPHFGGLWEAAVKSAKHLLTRSTSTASLTYEEFETIITEVEAILNSRPITPMSSDPNDLTALTPGHFLIGEPLTSPIDILASPIQRSLHDRWKQVSEVKHQFWDRWSKEYLSELQLRNRWKGPITGIKPNTMVILKEDNVPVLQWPLGRITNVYRGDDNLVRVVDVKTPRGTFKRPIHRLAPLFPEEEEKNCDELIPNNDGTTTEGAKPSKRRRFHDEIDIIPQVPRRRSSRRVSTT